MKNMFRKAITVLGSAALIGATVGAAAAASWPDGFTSNTALVYGKNAATADNIAATNIASDLKGAMVTSGGQVSLDGDYYQFEKSSTKFHLGDEIDDLRDTLDDDEMPILLAEGTYTDDNNDDFDYTQEIVIADGIQLTMFEDNDYADDEPTVGFRLANGDAVLNYTFTFSDEPDIADMERSDIMFMGQEYYILDAQYDSLTLLDSAVDKTIAEGESISVPVGGKTYTVSVNFVDDDEAILEVDSETTDKLSEGETQKLDDGAYVGVKQVLYNSKESGTSKVEFSIGSGKLELSDGSEVDLNEDNVDGLVAHITNSSAKMSSISLEWTVDEDSFITEDMLLSMPGFETVQLAFGGLNYPAEEMIMLESSGSDVIGFQDFPLKDGKVDIPLLYANGTNFIGIGDDDESQLLTSNLTTMTFDGDDHDYFIASWSDGDDAESYLMRATNFNDDDGTKEVDFQYWSGDSFVTAATKRSNGDDFGRGNMEIDVGTVDDDAKTVVITAGNANTHFDRLYSEEGLTVYLPYDDWDETEMNAINLSANPTSYTLYIVEENEDGDKYAGEFINVTLGMTGTSPNAETTVSGYEDDSNEQEIGSTEEFRTFIYSALATEILHDEDPDQKTLKLIYHGEEVTADAYITSSDTTIDGGTNAGLVPVTDDKVSTVSGKNLIVVGGSCINSVAADLLDGAYCESDFTDATDVGSGEFLIQSFKMDNGKMALLVAGYEAGQTTQAASYLTNIGVDTSAGKKYIGTSATAAKEVTVNEA
jgi:hypothetical protein